MKILFASDLHGSGYYTEKLIALFERSGAEKLVLLGDLYYHGPRNPLTEGYEPKRVAELLNPLSDKLLVIKGNCDSEVDEMISDFAFTPYAEIMVDGKKIALSHGHSYNIDNIPLGADVLIYGHIHTGFIRKAGDVLVANCGSVSLPKNGTKNSALILDGGKLSLVDLDGTVLEEAEINDKEKNI